VRLVLVARSDDGNARGEAAERIAKSERVKQLVVCD
jgi:hypothetical protein